MEVRHGAEAPVLGQAKVPQAAAMVGAARDDLAPAQAKALEMQEGGQVRLGVSLEGDEATVSQDNT